MSWFDNLKKWFWGDLKPELQEDLGMAGEEPIKKAQPKVIVTTDEVLEAAVKKTLEKEPEPKKQRTPRKRKPKVPEETQEKEVKKAPKKRAPKKTTKPKKPRKKKESNAD